MTIHTIDSFMQWRERKLYVGKTKEITVDFQRKSNQPELVLSEGEELERVEAYKYLGVFFDRTLS